MKIKMKTRLLRSGQARARVLLVLLNGRCLISVAQAANTFCSIYGKAA